MHRPLQYAASKLLENAGVGTLDEFLEDNADEPVQVVTSKLYELTDGVIVLDRRTVSRWIEQANA